MTRQDAPAEPPASDSEPVVRRQVNVRLPVDLIEQIDARRRRKTMSRDKWVENALRFALQQAGPVRGPIR